MSAKQFCDQSPPGEQNRAGAAGTQITQLHTTNTQNDTQTLYKKNHPKRDLEIKGVIRARWFVTKSAQQQQQSSQVFFRELEARKVEWTVIVFGCQVRRTLRGQQRNIRNPQQRIRNILQSSVNTFMAQCYCANVQCRNAMSWERKPISNHILTWTAFDTYCQHFIGLT